MRRRATLAFVALTLNLLWMPGSAAADPGCGVDRLLVAGSESPDSAPAMWWFSPDDGALERIDTGGQRAYLVALSPDQRWVTYYQRSSQAPAGRFVVDAWVMNITSGQRRKLADASTPIGWTSDGRGVVLGERPGSAVLVSSGEVVPLDTPVVMASSLRGLDAPDGQVRAVVAATPNGVAGIELMHRASGDLVLEVPTGRGAVQLAWSPDSTRLAYTNGVGTPDGLLWRLRLVDVGAHTISVPEATRDMELHSVVWAPALPDCE